MRARFSWILAVAAAVILLGFSGAVRSDGAIVPANDLYVATYGWGFFPDPGTYSVKYTWSSDLPISFTVSKTSGFVESFAASTSGSGSVKTESETVFFSWFNPNSENATLTYDLSAVSTVEHAIISWVTALIIGAVTVLVIIAVIVFLVVRSLGRSSQVAQPPLAPVPYPPVQGKCPSCGSSIDADSRFCAKCGNRTR
ncbi:MAG: zinc ribbon domain-containing protein [Thermoplasmata archaeon]|jgi:hypothetical protein|nr:zinc ribbon domain-containing protein [Thermoplasmata archaeon]